MRKWFIFIDLNTGVVHDESYPSVDAAERSADYVFSSTFSHEDENVVLAEVVPQFTAVNQTVIKPITKSENN